MYLAIDIGGTKTLLAAFTKEGKLRSTHRFATNPDYKHFKHDLAEELKNQFPSFHFTHGCCAVPARIDHKRGVALGFGNLEWVNIPIRRDLEVITKLPMIIENDAKLGGLSEALLVLDRYKKVLYLTISTGIGGGVIINGVIDPNLIDSEPGQMVIEHKGVSDRWEHFASGKAIVRRYHKRAADIDDPATWEIICHDLAAGMAILLATMQPEVVIIGGGVGAHFKKFGDILNRQLAKYETPLVSVPPVIGAERPDEAVIYGCYDLLRQRLI